MKTYTINGLKVYDYNAKPDPKPVAHLDPAFGESRSVVMPIPTTKRKSLWRRFREWLAEGPGPTDLGISWK